LVDIFNIVTLRNRGGKKFPKKGIFNIVTLRNRGGKKFPKKGGSYKRA